jgi:hypothetical protein
MDVAEGAIGLVAGLAFIGGVRRDPDVEIVPIARLEDAEL